MLSWRLFCTLFQVAGAQRVNLDFISRAVTAGIQMWECVWSGPKIKNSRGGIND